VPGIPRRFRVTAERAAQHTQAALPLSTGLNFGLRPQSRRAGRVPGGSNYVGEKKRTGQQLASRNPHALSCSRNTRHGSPIANGASLAKDIVLGDDFNFPRAVFLFTLLDAWRQPRHEPFSNAASTARASIFYRPLIAKVSDCKKNRFP